jgi:hypothetical protein
MKLRHKTHIHPLKDKKLGTPWNLGLHHTEETKKKISKSCKRVGIEKWNLSHVMDEAARRHMSEG